MRWRVPAGSDARGRYAPHRWHRARERWRHCVAYLPSAMPFRSVKAEPVREPMESGHLADSHAARPCVVDRPRAGEAAAPGNGARSQCSGKAQWRQLIEAANGIRRSRPSFRETATRNLGMIRARTAGQQLRIPLACVPVVPTAQLLSVCRKAVSCADTRLVGYQKFREPISVRQVSYCVRAGRPNRTPFLIPPRVTSAGTVIGTG